MVYTYATQRSHEFANIVVLNPNLSRDSNDGDLGKRTERRKRRQAQVCSLMLLIGIVLFFLAIAIILAEALSTDRFCSPDSCSQTLYVGIWLGAAFAFLVTCFSIRLCVTSRKSNGYRSSFDYSRWLLVNEIFTATALVAHVALLVVYHSALTTAANRERKFFDTQLLGGNKKDVTGSAEDEDSDVEFLRTSSKETNIQIYVSIDTKYRDFVVACSLKMSIGSMMILCDCLHLLIPLLNYVASRLRRRNRRKAGAKVTYGETTANERIIEDAVQREINKANEQTETHNAAVYCEPVDPSSADIQPVARVIEPQVIDIEASLFGLAKETSFFATLEATFGVSFKQNVVFDPDSPNSRVIVACKSQQEANDDDDEDSQRHAIALNTLKRFVEHYVRNHSTVLTICFPICLRDRFAEAQKRIRQTLDTVLRPTGVPYVQLAYNHQNAQIGLLCAAEESAIRDLEYVAHRRLRNLVLEMPEFFDVRFNVSCFSLLRSVRAVCNIFVYDGEVWRVPADFLVNSLDKSLQFDGLTGLAGEVHRAAGRQLRVEFDRINKLRGNRPLEVGQVITTGGFQLPAARLLHVRAPNANTPEYSKGDSFKLGLQSLYATIFDTVCQESPQEANDLKLALPLLSSGGYRGSRRIEDCFDPLLRALAYAADGALRRFAEIHIVDRDADKIGKLKKRITTEFGVKFNKETDSSRVLLVRTGLQPFQYAATYVNSPATLDDEDGPKVDEMGVLALDSDETV